MKTARNIIICALVATLPVAAQAQDSGDALEWRATIYGWLPDLSGTTNFPTGPGGDTPDISVDVDTILDSLDMTFMGTLAFNKGKWGMATDILYLDLGNSTNNSRDFELGSGNIPGLVELNAKLDLKAYLWTIAGTYRLHTGEAAFADLYVGARMLDMEQKLNWRFSGDIGELPLPGNEGSSKVSVTNWDYLVGLKGIRKFGRSGNWFIPWQIDVGTGDSDFVWQAMAGVGYSFSWGGLFLNYRYLDYDNGSDFLIESLTLSGPEVGAVFEW